MINIKPAMQEQYKRTIQAVIKLLQMKAKIFLSLIAYSEIWAGVELIDKDKERRKFIDIFEKMLFFYKRLGGKRDILIPDFLIGANAEFYSGKILTANPRDFMKYFRRLKC